MKLPAPAFPRTMSVEERGAVLRDYSARVVDHLVLAIARSNGLDPIAARAKLQGSEHVDDVRILAEFHCGISWLVERVDALEAEVRAPRRKRWGGRA
jgi:hypothetical protein